MINADIAQQFAVPQFWLCGVGARDLAGLIAR